MGLQVQFRHSMKNYHKASYCENPTTYNPHNWSSITYTTSHSTLQILLDSGYSHQLSCWLSAWWSVFSDQQESFRAGVTPKNKRMVNDSFPGNQIFALLTVVPTSNWSLILVCNPWNFLPEIGVVKLGNYAGTDRGRCTQNSGLGAEIGTGFHFQEMGHLVAEDKFNWGWWTQHFWFNHTWAER